MTADDILKWAPTIVLLITIGISWGSFTSRMDTFGQEIQELKDNQISIEFAKLEERVNQFQKQNEKDDAAFTKGLDDLKESDKAQWKRIGDLMDQ